MPRKIAPRWDTQAMVESRPYFFSDEAAARLVQTLGTLGVETDPTTLRTELEYIAELYGRDHNQEANVPSRAERNVALREIGELLSGAVSRLRAIDHETEFEIIDRLRAQGVERVSAYRRHLEAMDKVRSAVDSALRIGAEGRGPERSTDLARVVPMLVDTYERATGRRFTHNPNEGPLYNGRPHSEGDRFISAFFSIVDPKVASRLMTELATLIRVRNRTPKPEA